MARKMLRKTVASVLCITMAVSPLYGWAQEGADPIIQSGKDAQEMGEDLSEQAKDHLPTLDNNTLTFPALQGSGSTLDVKELFPSTGNNSSYFFPDGLDTDVESWKDVWNDSDSMAAAGTSAKGKLWEDAQKEEPSQVGSAYQILLNQVNGTRQDFTNDPMLDQSRQTYNDLDLISKGFADCKIEREYFSGNTKGHIPDYQMCERVLDRSTSCDVIHDYSAAVVNHYDGPFNISSCGENCTSMWIGKVGDNYWKGNCSVFEESTQVVVRNPQAVQQAILEYAKWDDYMQVWIGPPGQEQLVWRSDPNFPPETGGECELEESWERSLNVDVTSYFRNVAPESVVSLKIRVSVTGDGEGYGRIRLNYDPAKIVTKDLWTPQDCIDASKALSDGFGTGSIQCVDDPADQNGCVLDNGVKVCSWQLGPSPLPGVLNTCRRAAVQVDYDFYKGPMDCYTDINGQEQCPENDGGNLNSCAEFDKNPKCGFIESHCLEGAQGPSGTCYVNEERWDCGTDVDIPDSSVDEEYVCAGDFRCMGDECLTINREQSHDFSKAAAMLNAAQFMGQDMACTGLDDGGASGLENVTCEIFKGDAGECKKAVGGAVNCCEKPEGISLVEYVTMLMTVPKLDSAIMSLEQGNALRSAYSVLRDPVVNSWTEVTKPFTNYVDNITSAFDGVTQAVDGVISEVEGKLKEVVIELFGPENAIAGEAAQAGATTAAENIGLGQMISFVSTVYTVYTMSMLALKIIFKCTEDEIQTIVKRELKSCSYVGSYCKTKVLGACIEKREAYCCFASPLARILQEQLRAQLGLDFGDAEDPQCQGFTPETIAGADWSRIDLSEWVAILQSTGNFPDASSLSIEALTGVGSDFDLDGKRLDTTERTMERLQDSTVDDVRRGLSGSMQLETGAPGGAP